MSVILPVLFFHTIPVEIKPPHHKVVLESSTLKDAWLHSLEFPAAISDFSFWLGDNIVGTSQNGVLAFHTNNANLTRFGVHAILKSHTYHHCAQFEAAGVDEPGLGMKQTNDAPSVSFDTSKILWPNGTKVSFLARCSNLWVQVAEIAINRFFGPT